MRQFVLSVATAIFVGLVLLFGMTKCVDVANAKEPTTLEEALDRPIEVKSFVDKKNSVVCYYFGTHPNYLNCVYVPQPGLTWRNKTIIK